MHLCIHSFLASVVQWIEWQIPVLLIWVRFPSGVLAKYFERLCSATFCGYEVIPGVETGSDSFGEFPNHYHTISPVVRRSTVVGQTDFRNFTIPVKGDAGMYPYCPDSR